MTQKRAFVTIAAAVDLAGQYNLALGQLHFVLLEKESQACDDSRSNRLACHSVKASFFL